MTYLSPFHHLPAALPGAVCRFYHVFLALSAVVAFVTKRLMLSIRRFLIFFYLLLIFSLSLAGCWLLQRAVRRSCARPH
jgi:hypothetical protein